MNRIGFILLLVLATLLAFVEGRGWTREGILGTRIDALPVLVVYASLRGDFLQAVGAAVFAGLLFDSLSVSPLGTSLLSLMLVALLVIRLRGVVLRDQALAQAVLGGMVSALHPAIHLGVLWIFGLRPLIGWETLAHFGVLGLCGAVFTPLCFLLLDRLGTALTYERKPFSRFRSEVEIKRGRG